MTDSIYIQGTKRADHLVAGDQDTVIKGKRGADILTGGLGNDTLKGGRGRDTLEGGAGDDVLNGGRGRDTAVYSGRLEDYEITREGDSFIIRDKSGALGTDRLKNIEEIKFGDGLVLDLSDFENMPEVTGRETMAALNTPRINEIHYDNEGSDTGEFIEIRVPAGNSVTRLAVELYNGSNGTLYDTLSLNGMAPTGSDDAFDYYTLELPSNGLQNGSPDGLALISNLELVEFLSYEGTITASNGTAEGMTSTDIGVEEGSDTPAGHSLQRNDDGSWREAEAETPGSSNNGDPSTGGDNTGGGSTGGGSTGGGSAISNARINEIHYDNEGGDTGEFIEVRVNADADVSTLTVELYNGSNGSVYNTLSLNGMTPASSDGEFDYYTLELPSNGLQNGGPDGVALINAGEVVEFLSYEGMMTASGGAAEGMASTDIGVAETSSTPVGQSLQRNEDGSWSGPSDETKGAANTSSNTGGGNSGGGMTPGETPPFMLISEIQGSGNVTPMQGQMVSASAVVISVASNGFYMQEEDFDADDNASTSEGIFVFTGGAPDIRLGDLVYVTGQADEFFGSTQLTNPTVDFIYSGAELPAITEIVLPLTADINLEAVENMRVSLTTEEDDAPLTIIENFNFDRFGEIVVSSGEQIQPTQIFDAQTQADEIDALQAANNNNRIAIDDGLSSQNPDSFAYIANNTAGDDGDGILSAGDDDSFGTGPRLGATLDSPVTGVMTYSFGEYKIVPTETLDINPESAARPETAPDVGGDIQIAAFNVLNYFTSFQGGDTPRNPINQQRGAETLADLERQADKIVKAIIELDAEILAIQEIENNGFTEGSAIDDLVDRLNASAPEGHEYAYVDPTNDGGPIGTDAITTGLIYRKDVVSALGDDFLVFDDGPGLQRNRPAVAATFTDNEGGEVTVVSTHMKSKGPSGLDAGDPNNPNSDQGDGQGFWNAVRTDAAKQLAEWLETNPTGASNSDIIVAGDYNAYSQEDPVQAMEEAGYTNLLEEYVGADEAFSFVFDGQRGALDQGFASASAADNITDVAEWHINAPEPDLFSYNSEFNNPDFYADDIYASSDHDPLLIGYDFKDDVLV